MPAFQRFFQVHCTGSSFVAIHVSRRAGFGILAPLRPAIYIYNIAKVNQDGENISCAMSVSVAGAYFRKEEIHIDIGDVYVLCNNVDGYSSCIDHCCFVLGNTSPVVPGGVSGRPLSFGDQGFRPPPVRIREPNIIDFHFSCNGSQPR